jgi:hypothetical protein
MPSMFIVKYLNKCKEKKSTDDDVENEENAHAVPDRGSKTNVVKHVHHPERLSERPKRTVSIHNV